MEFQKASDFGRMDKLKCFIYGASGAGKTTLGATAPRPLILLCEGHGVRAIRRTNPDAAIKIISTSEDLRRVLHYLKEQAALDTLEFDTVILDSLTEMQKIFKTEMMNKGGTTKDNLTMGEWGTLIDRTANVARAFRDLPMHVIVLCLAKEEIVDERQLIRPSVDGKKLPNDLACFFNLVGYAFKRRDEESGLITHKVMFNGPERLLTKADPDLDSLEDPDFSLWVDKCYGEKAADEEPAEEPAEEKPAKAKKSSRKTKAAATAAA